jgi:hypothetical protein
MCILSACLYILLIGLSIFFVSLPAKQSHTVAVILCYLIGAKGVYVLR